MPTLLQKGNLKRSDPKYTQKALDKIQPLQHIKNIVSKKLSKPAKKISDRLVIVEAGTGSGKSTGLVHGMYEDFHRPGKHLLCTQPKILTAKENVTSILKWSELVKLGETIGYSTGPFKWIPPEGILFSTLGVLMYQLIYQEDQSIIDMYSFIFIDEVHERSIELDITLYLLREFMRRSYNNPDFPMIFLMSATFDYIKYADYFNASIKDIVLVSAASSFERTIIWADEDIDDYYDYSAKLIIDIHIKNKNDGDHGDMLMFIPIVTVGDLIKSKIKKYVQELNKLNILDEIHMFDLNRQTINGNMLDYRAINIPLNELAIILKKPNLKRKIFFGNVVAETGLTIDTLKYCIDCGLRRKVDFVASVGSTIMLDGPSSQSELTQRKGRIGREFPGIYYPLYTESSFNILKKDSIPNTMKTDPSEFILKILYLNGEFKGIPDLLDPLPIPVLDYSIYLTKSLGFYDTELGILASKLSGFYSLESMKMVLSGYAWDVKIIDLIEISAYLSYPTHKLLNYKKFTMHYLYNNAISLGIRKKLHPYIIRVLLSDQFIEGILVLELLKNICKSNKNNIQKIKEECSKVGIKYDNILNVLSVRDDIIYGLRGAGFQVDYDEPGLVDYFDLDSFMDYTLKLKRCIFEGYKNNIMFKTKGGIYKTRFGLETYLKNLYNTNMFELLEKKGYELNRRPNVVLYDKILSNPSWRGEPNFQSNVDRISVLDGFIDSYIDFH